MRAVPQLKVVREDQGWSQRDLAARSGVAQNTISQLERGERKAMPSTVRKLAGALEVEPSVLLAEFEMARLVARGKQTISKLPPEAREEFDQAARALDRQRKRERKVQESTAAKRHAERVFFGQAEPGERYETQEWAEEQWAEEYIASSRSHFEERFALQYHVVPSLVSYPEDLIVARSRLESGDPKETIEAAHLALRRAKRIVEEYDGKLQSFRRIPEHYYADPAAHSRIMKLQKGLSEQRVAAAEAIRELMDVYAESLDALEDQILGMRKESDVLEEFVMQAHDWER